MKHEIFTGALETMESIKKKGAKALNPKTMRWQIIDKTAKYKIKKVKKSTLYILISDIPLREIAKTKGLII